MAVSIQDVDKVEILTLQDNYIELTSMDNTEIVNRALPLKDMEVKNSVSAEHGFSALVSVTDGEAAHQLLFDFGFSENGAAANADALSVDMSGVETCCLSHGHLDHTGGIQALAEMIGKTDLDLVVHPAAFRNPRYMKIMEEMKVFFPPFTKEKIEKAGLHLVETETAYGMLGDRVFFLGQIPRTTDFEKGAPNLFFEENGEEKLDTFDDDTAIVMNLRGKGLVVLSGCAHSGIVNTIRYAKEVTGVDTVHAVMGGFHLSGPGFDEVIVATTKALKELNPTYVVPTHCTGRKAAMYMEKEMPDQFLLNMAGTRMTFAG